MPSSETIQTITVASSQVRPPEIESPSETSEVMISPISVATRAVAPRSAVALLSASCVRNGCAIA